MNDPVRHHYIPQFLLRNFCGADGYLRYFDVKTQKIYSKKPEEIFVTRNLYTDSINHPDDPTKIEKDFSRLENDASRIIKKFRIGDEICISTEEDELLKLFFALMAFRADRVKDMFGENADAEYKDFYSAYQDDGNLNDFWKRNLGELVNCRSLSDVWSNQNIDDPIKLFMTRDTYGVFGLYFILVERRGKENFLLSDSYPVIFEGIAPDGVLRLNLYSVYPIAPNRALILMANGAEATRQAVSGFDKKFFRKPVLKRDGKTLSFRVQKIYEQDVKRMNRAAMDQAAIGAVASPMGAGVRGLFSTL